MSQAQGLSAKLRMPLVEERSKEGGVGEQMWGCVIFSVSRGKSEVRVNRRADRAAQSRKRTYSVRVPKYNHEFALT